MADEPTVKVNLQPLKNFAAAVRRDLESNANGPIRNCMRQWAARVRSFLRERFVSLSRSPGGEWPDLKESTKRQRRGAQQGKNKGKRGKDHAAAGTFAILRDTGTLLNAITPNFSGQPGAIQQDIPFGVLMGYGGPARHPKGKATIADIAAFHQEGEGRLPARKIIVDPPGEVTSAMQEDFDRACERLLKETGN